MNKYNVGDVVKLRDDLEVGKVYGRINFATKMKELKNKPVEIFYRGFQGDYTVQEGWIINNEMIEGLWEECKEKQDKLKLIDVLNMIAKGELKEGTKVKYAGVEYTYKKFDEADDESKDLISDSSCSIFEDYFLTSLQDEVELIEPPCEDEHIVGADKTIEPSKIEELIADETDLDCLGIDSKTILSNITDKLNEVIRKINKE